MFQSDEQCAFPSESTPIEMGLGRGLSSEACHEACHELLMKDYLPFISLQKNKLTSCTFILTRQSP